jgi:Cu2+-exporting ATPase
MTTCTLCDLPADEDPVTGDSVEGTFCCRGCLEVYRAVGDVDPAEALGPERSGEDAAAVPDGAKTAYLSVDGMHCSTCELFLESSARDCSGVYDADASYAAETVKVVYDPEVGDTDAVVDAMDGLGYAVAHRGKEAERGTDVASRLLVGGLFGMMAMTWYAVFLYPTYFGYDPIVTFGTFDGLYLYGQLAIVTAIVLLYTGRPILRGAYVSLRTGRPNVDLLISIAALAAYTYSTGRLLVGGSDLYYDVTIVVVMAVTVGNYYESRIKDRTTGLLSDLTELQVDSATRAGGETVDVSEIEPGDELLVSPGERIPLDGTVVEGTAAVDEALVTGESMPETKSPGDNVRGGTIVTDAPLVVAAGDEATSTLDRVVDLLWEIQATRPGAQRVADRLAVVFVPLVLTVATLVTAVLVATGSSPQTGLLVGLTVLIVSCPCALGLATPLAVATGLKSAAESGVVITTPALFEQAGDVDTVVFDKTGTLTSGELTVTDVRGDDRTLRRAATVEQFSGHPIARAITTAAEARLGPDAINSETNQAPPGSVTDGPVGDGGLAVEPDDAGVSTFQQYSRGVAATVDGTDVLVGHPLLFRGRDWTVPESFEEQLSAIAGAGGNPVVVGWDRRARGIITVEDTPRSEWEEVAETLSRRRRLVVLTGDDGATADRLRGHPAIDDVFAGVPPDGKAETIRRLGARNTVAMVGDGSNDAPALAAADVGIALDGTQLASDAADAVVIDGDLRTVPAVFEVATRTNRRIRENLLWAFLYNGVAIPLAISGLLNPLLAALAMASSSLVVVGNSARGLGIDDSTDPTETPTSGAVADNSRGS